MRKKEKVGWRKEGRKAYLRVTVFGAIDTKTVVVCLISEKKLIRVGLLKVMLYGIREYLFQLQVSSK